MSEIEITEAQKSATGRAPAETRAPRLTALASLPVFFKLGGKRAIVVGGGEAAAWKVEILAAAGSAVDVYAEEVSTLMREVANAPPAGHITLHMRRWRDEDFDGAAIAIATTEDEHEAGAVAAAARARGVPVNVVDKPQFCDFQFGAIVNRSPLVVAISTDGGAPVFAQAIRSEIETLLPDRFKLWAEVARRWRRLGDKLGRTMAERRQFWELFTRRALQRSDRAPDEHDLEALIAEASLARSGGAVGSVTLVGAGPGDPELLTLKAVRALRTADVILYDDLVAEPLLDFGRREAQRILVGKTGYGPACKQTEINALMVSLAQAGKRVVRLKAGDPMIFGRAGEEMVELRAAGIPFSVIPGISAVQAAAAGLQVSLTHREHAKRVQFITGHARDGKLPESLDWSALADPCATTAVYMALRTFRELKDKLLAAGLAAETPAIAVFNATRSDESRIAGTLASLPERLAATDVSGPCLVLIGAVFAGLEQGTPDATVRSEPEPV